MTTQLSHPKYRSDIDGLRAIAVLSVVVFHAFPKLMKGGFIGVDVFFVISGFLISTIIFENLDKGTFSIVEFYNRRIRRIFPALIFVLVSCLIIGWFVLLAEELNQLGKHLAGGAGFISNLLLWSEAGYFDSASETKPLLHLWSLGVEEQFYIIWPVILWCSYRKRLNLAIIGIVIALASYVLNIYQVTSDVTAAFFSPLTRFWELMFGGMLAWLTLYKKTMIAVVSTGTRSLWQNQTSCDCSTDDRNLWASIISCFALLMLIYGFFKLNNSHVFPGKYALIPVIGTFFVILAGPRAWVNRTILSNKVAVWFGLISFPLYLWHWPLLTFARIVENGEPNKIARIVLISLSVLLAWLTVKIVEKPFRFGNQRTGFKIGMLVCLLFGIGIVGLIVNNTDFSQSHSRENLVVKRKNTEHMIGNSLAWFRGSGDWLFLGNAHNNTVAKLKLAIVPTEKQLADTKGLFTDLCSKSAQYKTRVVLIVGPDKPSIYPEYLSDELVPSHKKYVSYFLNELKNVHNLTVYDPTEDLLRLKHSEGLLYWMTDTHWNNKGAFLTYKGFSKIVGLPVPNVRFKHGSVYRGDLIEIAKLKGFPLHLEDNWDVVWENMPDWTEKEISHEQKTSFGSTTVVINKKPLSDKTVWVIGDSFSLALKQYFNATFKEVYYVGHWDAKHNNIAQQLVVAEQKPDMIVVVKVERSF